MKLLLLLSIGFLFLGGCKKDDPPFQGYIKLTINGRPDVFNQDAYATGAMPGSDYLVLRGKSKHGSLEIRHHRAKLGVTEITGTNWVLYFILADFDIPGGYYAGDEFGGGQSGSGKINILELTNEYVKAEFEFTTPEINGTKRTVTNGELHLKRDR